MDFIKLGSFLSLSRTSPDLLPINQRLALTDGATAIVLYPGVILFEPKFATNKHIVLSCGIHGNETAPIEICDELVTKVLTGSITLAHRVLFIFGNLPAMDISQRFVEENLNRLFERNIAMSNPERRRALDLMNTVDGFFDELPESDIKLHYDLHTAIRDSKNEKFLVYPFQYGREYNKEQLQFMSMCGVKTVLLSTGPTATFSHYSSKYHNAHAFTVELGKVRPFGKNDMSRFAAANYMLEKLISESYIDLPEFETCDITVYKVAQEIIKTKDDFRLHFPDDTANFTEFSKNEVIASENGREYKVKSDNEAIVFPNANVAIGQRALITVVPHDI